MENDIQKKAPAATKSRLIALVFWLFLGQFGGHNFYLNHKRAAYTQLFMAALAYAGLILVGVMTSLTHNQATGGMDISDAFIVILGSSLAMGVAITLGLWLIVDLILILFKKDENLVWSQKEA